MRKALLILLAAAAMCGFFNAPAQAETRGLDTSLRPTYRQYVAMHAAGYGFIGRHLPIPDVVR